MQISIDTTYPRSSDIKELTRVLPEGSIKLLELGCGRAETTRKLASNFPTAQIIATEVDRIQHEKNLQIDDLENVDFHFGGAEAIDQQDNSVDAVIMLKSLHHVPGELLDQSLVEIARVLKPGAFAYISEPVYAGEFNDIIKLFHDEKIVRENAFAALQQAVASGIFELQEEFFFASSRRYQGFEEFEEKMIGATHSEFDISDEVYKTLKERFATFVNDQGMAEFMNPNRVDILRKPL